MYSLEKINEIAMGNEDVVKRLNSIFVEQTIDIDLSALKQFAGSNDWEGAQGVAHKMKPVLELYQIRRSFEIIRQIDHLNGDPSDPQIILILIEELEQELEIVKEQLTA